jgi:hypothetical protein
MADDGRSRCEIVGEDSSAGVLFILYLSFIVLLAFAALYSPLDAVSRPADHGNSAVMPAKQVEEPGSRTHQPQKAVDPLKVDRAEPSCKTQPPKPHLTQTKIV